MLTCGLAAGLVASGFESLLRLLENLSGPLDLDFKICIAFKSLAASMGQGGDGQPLEGAQVVPLDIESSPVGSTQPAAALASAAPLAGASAVPPSGTMEILPATKSAEAVKGGPAKSVSFRRLFTYADKLDVICIVVGTLGAVAMGAAMPLLTLLFGRLINAFGNNSSDPNELYKQVKTVRMMVLDFVLEFSRGLLRFLVRASR